MHVFFMVRSATKKKEIYIKYGVPELDSKRPCKYNVFAGKPITFTTENDIVSKQIQLMMTFLKSGGEFWGLEEYWTQVVALTGHSVSVADLS